MQRLLIIFILLQGKQREKEDFAICLMQESQVVGTYRAEIGQAYKPVSLASVRDDIYRGGTHSCTEGHSRDSTAVRWKYAFVRGRIYRVLLGH